MLRVRVLSVLVAAALAGACSAAADSTSEDTSEGSAGDEAAGVGGGAEGATTGVVDPKGSSSSAGGAGTGGEAATSGGAGSPSVDPHQEAIDRAKSGVGFSYWWGHGAFLPQGPDADNAGSCSGSCPDCTHDGEYGGDCSGFVAKVWVVPATNDDLSVDDHPYSTFDFVEDSSEWTTIDQATLQAADAMVYNNGSAGHIFIYDHGDPWGSMYAYECKGCSYGCTAGLRTASSAYHAIRRTGF